MSNIVGLDRQPIDHRTLEMDMTDAQTALRALLARMEAGEVRATRWLLLFDDQDTPGMESLKNIDSGITVERAIHMLELTKFSLLRMSFGENPT